MKKNFYIIAVFCVICSICLFSCSLKTPVSPTVDTSMTAWVEATANAHFSPRFCHVSLAYNGRLWVIGGRDNSSAFFGDVWSTPDGASWRQALPDTTSKIGGRAYFDGVIFNDTHGEKMYIIAGSSQTGPDYKDVLSSSNGIDWTTVTGNAAFGARDLFSCAVYNNHIWLSGGRNTGGDLNDVWRSSNGADWDLVTGNAAFSARNSHKMLSYDNKLWVIGGLNTAYCRDVWYSTNGADWTLATGNAAFDGQGTPGAVVYNDKMVLLAGENNTAPFYMSKSVWSSTDGADWALVTGNAGFGYRDMHSAAVFDNRIFVIAGQNGSGPANDVWKMK